jgi:DNA-binding transcriptional MerR regulator
LADDSTISGSLQETILTALVYKTDEHTRTIFRLINTTWFETPYNEIAIKVLEYWRQEDSAPDVHIDDVLDNVLKDPTHQKYATYSRVISRLARLSPTLNTKYVYGRVFEFARRQNLKRAIFEAGTILSQSDAPEDYDKVEGILSNVTRFYDDGADLGFSLADMDRSLEYLDREEEDNRGEVQSIETEDNPAVYQTHEEQKQFLMKKIPELERADHQMSRLRIKGFPTGDLTYDKLEAFLDHLESRHSFIPNVVLLDYPDLMSYDSKHDPRLAIGRLYQQLRGLAVKRDIALVVASQSNREGETAKLVESYHAAEDISKIATADYVVTYNQTKQEQELGIARLYVAKARNERQWFSVLISQNYAAAQFYIDSANMSKKYLDLLKPKEC